MLASIAPPIYRLIVQLNDTVLLAIPRYPKNQSKNREAKSADSMFEWTCPSAPGPMLFWREQSHLESLCKSWFIGAKAESIQRIYCEPQNRRQVVSILIRLSLELEKVEFGPFAKMYRLLKFVPVAEVANYVDPDSADFQLLGRWQEIQDSVNCPKLVTKTLKVDGCEIAYSDSQSDQNTDSGSESQLPLVMIHGLGTDQQNFRWHVEKWSQTRRIIAIDLPGHGDSQVEGMTQTVPFAVRMVIRCLESLQIGDFDLLGFSLGGFVSSLVAAELTDRVKHLILLAPAGLQCEYTKPKQFARMARVMRSSWYPMLRPALFRLRYSTFYERMRTKLELFRSDELVKSKKPLFRAHLAAYADYFESIARQSARQQYPKITAPTLIIHGAEDQIVRVQDSQVMEQLIPNCQLEIISNCGHMLPLEYFELVDMRVMHFVEQESSESIAEISALKESLSKA